MEPRQPISYSESAAGRGDERQFVLWRQAGARYCSLKKNRLDRRWGTNILLSNRYCEMVSPRMKAVRAWHWSFTCSNVEIINSKTYNLSPVATFTVCGWVQVRNKCKRRAVSWTGLLVGAEDDSACSQSVQWFGSRTLPLTGRSKFIFRSLSERKPYRVGPIPKRNSGNRCK